MKRFLDAAAGYILAVFMAALVITLSVTSFTSPGSAEYTNGPNVLTGAFIFWISAASRIAVAALIPGVLGIIIANLTGLRTTAFYCLWAIAIAIGLSLITNHALSLGSLLTLCAAGLAAGLAYRYMNPPAKSA